jgi:uncharacterized membrane protein
VSRLVNLLDLRSALLARHAQHVVLVHFPIALFLTGVVFDAAARLTKKTTLALTARLNILAAGVMALPTLATGILAWQWQLEGQNLKGALLVHLLLGCASSVLILIVAWMQLRKREGTDAPLPRFYLPAEVVTAGLIALTAHIGGFLSGVNVIG